MIDLAIPPAPCLVTCDADLELGMKQLGASRVGLVQYAQQPARQVCFLEVALYKLVDVGVLKVVTSGSSR